MATTTDNYKIKVTVEGSEGLKNLRKDMEDLGAYGGPFGNVINGIIGKLGPLGLAASAAGAAFVALGSRALQLAGDLSDISGATGIAAGTLMNFRQSVVEAGGKAEDFGQIAAKLNQSVQEAAAGNEKFQESFRTLGVFVTDVNGKVRPTEAILRDLVERFRTGQLSSAQYAAAIDILGKNINKLELGKLNAVADPIKDEQVRQIDKYNEAIDKLAETINNKLITAFGSLAVAINNALGAQDRFLKAEEEANRKGQTFRTPTEGFMNRPLFGAEKPPLTGELIALPNRLRDMTEKEKAAYKASQEAAAAHANEMQRLLNKSQGKDGQNAQGGGFGATPEAVLNAEKASQKRIAELRIEQERQSALEINNERLSAILLFADQQEAIEQRAAAQVKEIVINSEAELSKAKLEIYSQEKLSKQQKDLEFAAKEKELQLKQAADISRARAQLTEQLERERKRIEDIITQSKARVTEEAAVNGVIERRNKFFIDNATLTDKERQRAQELFDLEEERLKVLRQIALIKDIPPEERAKREKEVNDIFAQRKGITERQQEADRKLQDNFIAGTARAYRQYAEDARNNFQLAGRIFSTVTQTMEDSIVNFTKTGKFEFKNFLNIIVEELLRSQVRQLIANTFSFLGPRGSGGGRGGLLGGAIIPGFLASGGPANANRPYIVGERGPELFVPNTTGTVVPNNALGGSGTSVTYNINAVDAMSFKQMLAKDPSFLYAVTEQGRRKLPGGR